MDIFYKSEAIKNLKRLNAADQQKAKKKIRGLLSHPLGGKKLKGEFAGLRSLRAWPLRIIYHFDVNSQNITIITVHFRGSVYQ